MSVNMKIAARILALAVVGLTLVLLSGFALPAFPSLGRPHNTPEAQTVAISASPVALVAHGAELYTANCQACHGDRNGVGRIAVAPPHNQDGHTWHHSDRNLTDIIKSGSGEMGDMMRRMAGVPQDAPRMPAWGDKLSDEDIRAILAFLKTWWTPEQRATQSGNPMMR